MLDRSSFNILLFSALCLLVLPTCSEEEFTSTVSTSSESISPEPIEEVRGCSKRTIERPKVDFLFVVDNSPSINNLQQELKTGIRNLVDNISKDFDYRVYAVPLIPPTGYKEGQAKGVDEDLLDYDFASSNLNGIPIQYQGSKRTLSSMRFFYDLPSDPSSLKLEKGFNRTITVLKENLSAQTEFFRRRDERRGGSHLIVVLISNGDDNDYGSPGEISTELDKARALREYRDELELFTEREFRRRNGVIAPEYRYRAQSLRFISLVKQSQCSEVRGVVGNRYIEMSRFFYRQFGQESDPSQYPDSFDLCSSNLANVFRSLEETIRSVQINHRYNYWLIDDRRVKAFNPDKLRVFKTLPGSLQREEIPRSATNGFTFTNQYYENQNTRISPCSNGEDAICEPTTGWLVELHGNSILRFPECLIIEKVAPTRFYGYIVLPQKPRLDPEPVVEINGNVIPQYDPEFPDRPSWKYLPEFDEGSKIIEIKSENNFDRVEGGETASGFFLQLFNITLKSGDDYNVDYRKAPIEQ